jgi:hypothetical protein
MVHRPRRPIIGDLVGTLLVTERADLTDAQFETGLV